MNRKDSLALISALSDAYGPSGFEDEAVAAAREARSRQDGASIPAAKQATKYPVKVSPAAVVSTALVR